MIAVDSCLIVAGPATPRNAVHLSIQSVHRLYPEMRIKVLAPRSVLFDLLGYNDIDLIDENHILNKDSFRDKYVNAVHTDERWNWYYQQFLKYSFSRSKYNTSASYFLLDGDAALLRRLPLCDGEKYCFYAANNIHHPYMVPLRKLFGDAELDTVDSKNMNFVSGYMVFDTKIMDEMLSVIGDDWIGRILGAMDENHIRESGFSEYQTYVSYMYCRHNDIVSLRPLRFFLDGIRVFGGSVPQDYAKLLEERIDADIVGFETWSMEKFYSNRIV